MSVDYDPYSHEAMTEPRPLYARLRAEDPVHHLREYDAWALASFEAVWQACSDTQSFTCTRGQTPNQVLLGEPTGHTFPELDPPEHRLRRRVLAPDYTRAAAEEDSAFVRATARSVLIPLLDAGAEELDVYRDYASRVTARVAAHKAGIPITDAEDLRRRMDGMFARDPGQKGTSEANLAAIMEVFAYLGDLVGSARRDPSSATGHLATLLDAEVDGVPLTDEQITAELHTIMVTGSETSELGVASAVEALARHPEQLADVRGDPSLLPFALAEALRCDHPTNMLCRAVSRDVDVQGRRLREGQGVLLLWASANLDEREHPAADVFDVHRRPARSLLFGHGQHKCLGEHLAMVAGTVLLDELLHAVGDYEVDLTRSERLYGEFLKGFTKLPIRFTAR